MTGRRAALAAAARVLLVGTVLVTGCSQPAEDREASAAGDQTPTVEPNGDEARLTLYFPGGGGWLVAEERLVPVVDRGVDLEAIAAEVLAGPTTEGLYAPFPDETRVGSVFVSSDGVAYVDLVSNRARPPSSGSRQEMLSVYSLVNSVLTNLPDLTGVVLLWNGQQRATFAGHLDTGRPLRENRTLIAR